MAQNAKGQCGGRAERNGSARSTMQQDKRRRRTLERNTENVFREGRRERERRGRSIALRHYCQVLLPLHSDAI